MKIIIFVRHGQSRSNVTNTLSSDIDGYPLTERGIQQAEALAKTIPESIKIDSFYTSPILRTVQTAEILSEKLGMKPVLDDRLREWRLGGLNNIAFPSQEAIDAKITEEVRSGSVKGMETWDSIRARMKSFAYSVNGITVAVTHQAPILSALGIVERRYERFDSKNKVAEASTTTIDFESKKILGIGSATFPKF